MDKTSPLIGVAELAEALAGDRPPALLDIRYVLPAAGPSTETGADQYAAGHLPGAHFVDLERDLAAPPGPPGDGGRHPLPDPELLGAALRRAGVSADRPVVVYDGGPATSAARAWWLLRWAGHQEVRVLDGGLAAWRSAGHPVTGELPQAAAGDFKPVPASLPTLDKESAGELARTGLLLDSRAGERYRGEVEPLDPRAGHIPGAVSAPTFENNAPDGRFRPVAELAERFRELGADGVPVVGVYCGSGVTAAHNVLALELAGYPTVLYPGSWSEWSSDPERPAATGPERG
ncbi:sulfurtransferase [Kitasatospora viridis]|nr:sulfurtransferase [Kitasatospora viridis]